MRTLVTGISGRIGANLATALLDAGHEVRGLVWPQDPRPEKLRLLDVELMHGDLVNPDDVRRAVDGIEVICHLGAAFQGGGPFTERQYLEINVQGTFNVLEAARQNAASLQHLFFASTDAAYIKYVPGGMSHPIREDEMPMLPKGWYPLSKLLGEDLCLGYHRTYDLPVTVFRFSMTVAGDELLDYRQFHLDHWLKVYEGMSGEAAGQVYKELSAYRNGRERLLLARDEQGRAYKKHIADVRDITLAFVDAIGVNEVIGEVFQLGGPGPFTWEEAIPYLAEKLGMEYVDLRLADHIPTFYEFDLAKAERVFGYRPQFDIYKMIDSAIACREGRAEDVIPTYVSKR